MGDAEGVEIFNTCRFMKSTDVDCICRLFPPDSSENGVVGVKISIPYRRATMNKKTCIIIFAGLTGCATTSGVMPGPNGTYTISAFAAPVRGGATGAYQTAFEDAQKYCAKSGKNAIVLDGQDRDVYQSTSLAHGSFNANSSGAYGSYGAGGGTFASGNAKLTFRCDPPAAK